MDAVITLTPEQYAQLQLGRNIPTAIVEALFKSMHEGKNSRPIEIGNKVKETKDTHIGRVVAIDLKRNECYVYWHKGYSSWVKCYDLVYSD